MAEVKFVLYSDPDFMLVKSIRMQVFMNEQNIKGEEEFDELDKRSLFALLFDGNSAVATARISEIPKGLKIGRIAVLKDYRGRRYGAKIVNAVVAKSIEAGADRVYVDAQNHAVNFYEKLGFRICGTELIDRGIVHTPMCIDKGDFNVEE